jgi:benzoyl-CoA reductase/2-hydroxyglutaryl-CoA dehydratase subunit BcrC/BadD/HgdB
MEERNIRMLILESTYGKEESGQLKIRLEAFIDTVKRGIEQ